MTDVYQSSVFYHSNTPVLEETIAVRLPRSTDLENLHLQFMFKHCQTDRVSHGNRSIPFAFTWMKLTDTDGVILSPAKEGTSVGTRARSPTMSRRRSIDSKIATPFHQAEREDSYELPCYVPLPSMTAAAKTRGDVAADVSYLAPGAKLKRRTVSKYTMMSAPDYEAFHVQMQVTSTSRTTARDLEKLLQWKTRGLSNEELIKLLDGITFVDPREQAKLMRKLFDTTCSLFPAKKDHFDVQLKVFELLVHILGNPSAKVKVVIQNYIESPLFDGRSFYSTLIDCIKHYTKNLEGDGAAKISTDQRRLLNKIVASFTTIISMIVIGRTQAVEDAADDQQLAQHQPRQQSHEKMMLKVLEKTRSFRTSEDYDASPSSNIAGADEVDWSFLKSVEELVRFVSRIMMFKSTQFLTIQGKVLQSFSGAVGDLARVFPPEYLGRVVHQFVLSSSSYSFPKHQTQKLQMIRGIVEGPAFQTFETRSQVTPLLITLIRAHLDGPHAEMCESVAIAKALFALVQVLPGEEEDNAHQQQPGDGSSGSGPHYRSSSGAALLDVTAEKGRSKTSSVGSLCYSISESGDSGEEDDNDDDKKDKDAAAAAQATEEDKPPVFREVSMLMVLLPDLLNVALKLQSTVHVDAGAASTSSVASVSTTASLSVMGDKTQSLPQATPKELLMDVCTLILGLLYLADEADLKAFVAQSRRRNSSVCSGEEARRRLTIGGSAVSAVVIPTVEPLTFVLKLATFVHNLLLPSQILVGARSGVAAQLKNGSSGGVDGVSPSSPLHAIAMQRATSGTDIGGAAPQSMLLSHVEIYRQLWLVMHVFELTSVVDTICWMGKHLQLVVGANAKADIAKAGEHEQFVDAPADGGAVVVAGGDDDDDSDDGEEEDWGIDREFSKDKANADVLSFVGWEVDHEASLYVTFFGLCYDTINHPYLQIEKEKIQERRQLISADGDLRERLCYSWAEVWGSLDAEAKLMCCPHVVLPLLQMTRSPCVAVRTLGSNLYLGLLAAEYKEWLGRGGVEGGTSAFSRVEVHTIDAVGRIVEEEENSPLKGEGARPFVDLFKVELKSRVHEYGVLVTEEAAPRTKVFLNEIVQLHELLCSMARFPCTVEYEDDRASACLRLMAYLLKTNRKDLYVRYVHTLVDLHKRLKNDVEAANSLMLHVKNLDWDNQKELEELQLADMTLPREKECERKERLMSKVIEYLDNGNEWERVLELSEEMRLQYYQKYYMIERIRNTLTNEAELWRRINNQDRFQGNYPAFFSVSFFGQPFPEGVRNREFVYRGDAFEMTRDFRGRILQKYSSEPLKNIKSLDDAVVEEAKAGASMLVNFSTVRTCRLKNNCLDDIDDMLAQKLPSSVIFEEVVFPKEMPDRMRTHVCNSGISVFVHTRSFSKRKQQGLPKSKNEFLDLWILRRYLFCDNVLPSTNRRAFVKDVRMVALNPLEYGVTLMLEKTVEIQKNIKRISDPSISTADQGFTSMIKGVVDAAVMGGVSNYSSFIDGTFKEHNPEVWEDMQAHPHKLTLVDELIQAYSLQVKVLDDAIALHKAKLNPQMGLLHELMEKKFQEMKQEVESLAKAPPGK
jgi:hypothetical protein